ncbi:SRPBCC family protein [Candidatus Nephthysia bennettiae]|uniref:SRPBCC family protein n=1 Tax=Candidatus Nephthysia bennettiae TaxID=3127016 RepID=A0A934K337_9BACT|nr:SRPBCC family protein [Candidatus Dormibacteraeota bacterium]MBJ7613915.1 SRPBCC family protein [Candidatus Dormibacteraeota bacterium]
MKAYDASSTIAASPEALWAILTDAPGYTKWDSGVDKVEGRIAPGEKIKVVSKANPGRAFPVRVSQFEPGKRMVWSGGMPLGLFKGVRPSRSRRRTMARRGSRCARSTQDRCSR